MQWQGGKTCRCHCITQFLTWVFLCLKLVRNSTHNALKKKLFPLHALLPSSPISNSVNTPPLLACPFFQQTSQGARGACVVTGLLRLRCCPYFCSTSMIIKKCHHMHLPPHYQSAWLECHCPPSGMRRGGVSNATTSQGGWQEAAVRRQAEAPADRRRAMLRTNWTTKIEPYAKGYCWMCSVSL